MRTYPSRSTSHPRRGTTALRVLLLAVLVPSVLPETIGRDLPAPFGAPRSVVAGVALVVLATLVARTMPAAVRSTQALLRVLAWLAAIGLLAAIAGAIVRVRATAFYTAQTLADVMAVLLVLHAVGSAFGRVSGSAREEGVTSDHAGAVEVDGLAAAHRRRARWRLRSRDPSDAGDWFDGVAAAFVTAFWLLAAVGVREAAGVMLLAGAVVVLASVPARAAQAWARTGASERLRARR